MEIMESQSNWSHTSFAKDYSQFSSVVKLKLKIGCTFKEL